MRQKIVHHLSSMEGLFFLPSLSPISVLYLDICTCVYASLRTRFFFHKINFLKGHEKMKVTERENCHYDNRK